MKDLLFLAIIGHIILGIRAVPLQSTNQPTRLFLQALDCRVPQRITSGLMASICTKHIEKKEAKSKDTLILQLSTKHVVSGYKCSKRETVLREICGQFSHSKLFSPPDILAPAQFGQDQCRQTVLRQSYTKEDGNQSPIILNQELNYKYLRHGSLTISENNVRCEGARVNVDGEIHSSIVEMVTTTVLIQQIDIEIDGRTATDLDIQVALPTSCSRDDTCQVGSVAYYIEHPANSCPLYTIRTIPMDLVQINTIDGEREALLSKPHKLLLTLGQKEVAHSNCRPIFHYRATSYPDIKVITDAEAVANVNNIATHLPPSILNLDLEIRTSEEFLSYLFEETLRQTLERVGRSICKMGAHGLGHAELSPFHPNSLLRVRGDIVQELTCTAVTVEVRLGENRGCYEDTLPIWLNNQPLYLQAESHLVLEEADISRVDCKSVYPPIFLTNDQKTLVQASPTVEVIEIALTHLEEDYLHLVTGTQGIVHTGFEEDILYTTNEIDQFNNLIHFSRTKKRVLNAMVSQYCTDNPSCGTYQPTRSGTTFSLDHLEEMVESPFAFLGVWEDKLAKIGSYCSIFILLLTCLTIMYKCCHIVWLTCKHKLGFSEAIKLGFFVNHTMIDALIQPEHSTPVVQRRRTRLTTPPREENIPLRVREQHTEASPSSTAIVPYQRHDYSWTH